MISIHQSQFLPWLPYFYKILKSDVFIIMDDVQYQKNGVQNRNMIKTPTGESYITIPVISNSKSLINEVQIQSSVHLQKMIKTLSANYSKTKYFGLIYPQIEDLIKKNNYNKLNDLNIDLILLFLDLMAVHNVEIRYSSEFKFQSKKDDLVLDLIMATGQRKYISGFGALDYMDLNKFKAQEIDIYLYDFKYKDYEQVWNKIDFIPNLSIIDLLFSNLDIAKDYILENGSLKPLKI